MDPRLKFYDQKDVDSNKGPKAPYSDPFFKNLKSITVQMFLDKERVEEEDDKVILAEEEEGEGGCSTTLS